MKPAVFFLAASLACAASPGKPSKVFFVGPKGETAVEYLLGETFSKKEINKWKADKKVYRYHIYLAVSLNTAAQNLKSAQADEADFYTKLKLEKGGASGVLDVSLLASVENGRSELAEIYSEISEKTGGKEIPPAFSASNSAFLKYAQAQLKLETSRSGALSKLISEWRESSAGTEAPFPIKKMYEGLNSGTKEAKKIPELYSGWQKAFLKDCEKYFGRKFEKKPSSKNAQSNLPV